MKRPNRLRRAVRPIVLLALAATAPGCFLFSHSRKQAPHPVAAPVQPGQQPPVQPGPGFAVQTPEDLLRPGAVHSIEQALMERGYLAPNTRRTLTEADQDAIARFQRDNGLPATGYPDESTLKKLGFDPAKVFLQPQEVPEAK